MYKALLTTILLCLAVSTYSQQTNFASPPMEPFMASSYIGIPRNGKVQFYLHKYDEKKNGYFWTQGGEFPIPAGTVAMAGNERKLILLFKDSIVFYEDAYDADLNIIKWERYSAFPFDSTIRITPQNWLRNPYSTECDFTWLEGNLERGYTKDGDKWFNLSSLIYEKTKPEQPLLPCGDYKYVFNYMMNGIIAAMITNDAITFCMPSTFSLPALKKYEKAEVIQSSVGDAQSRTFTLPSGTESVFVFEWETIAVVSKQGIDFYQYSG